MVPSKEARASQNGWHKSQADGLHTGPRESPDRGVRKPCAAVHGTHLGRWLSNKVPPELHLGLCYRKHIFLARVSVLGSLAFLAAETGEALAV